jgi:hypothetical protein
MIFEVSKCYQHTSGKQIKVIGDEYSKLLGQYFVTENTDGYFGTLFLQNNQEGWHEISEEEWLKNFS